MLKLLRIFVDQRKFNLNTSVKILVFLLLLFFTACQSPVNEFESYYKPDHELSAQIDKELQSITNARGLADYLERIHHLDQQYRMEESLIVQEFGYDSEEHKNIWKKINQTDAQNYFRIIEIFNKFGYPHIDSVGKQAAMTPLLVIHHSPFYEHRVKHFGMVYKGYLDGNVDEGAICLYMERMHMMKFDEMFKMPGPYRMNNKIDTLIKVLELEGHMLPDRH